MESKIFTSQKAAVNKQLLPLHRNRIRIRGCTREMQNLENKIMSAHYCFPSERSRNKYLLEHINCSVSTITCILADNIILISFEFEYVLMTFARSLKSKDRIRVFSHLSKFASIG